MLSLFGQITLVILLSSIQEISAKTVCVEGFVMDKFCIDLGVLLDNSNVITLENPELHSVHCLVDVDRCVRSGYNILEQNPFGSTKYKIAYKLDDAGNNQVLQTARAIGKDCSTCAGSTNQIKQGFRATVLGEIGPVENGVTLLKVIKLIASPKLDDLNGGDGCPSLLIHSSNSSSIAASPSYHINMMTASPSSNMKMASVSPSYHTNMMTASPSSNMKMASVSPSYHTNMMTASPSSNMKIVSVSPSYSINNMATTITKISLSPSITTIMSSTHFPKVTTEQKTTTTTQAPTTTTKTSGNRLNRINSSPSLIKGHLGLSLVLLMVTAIIMAFDI